MATKVKSYCPVKKAHYNRRTRYNLTPEAYYTMLAKQKGRCAICNKLASLNCDHRHTKAKKVRGLLCNNCNLLIGFALDNIEILKAAIKYLRKHKKI